MYLRRGQNGMLLLMATFTGMEMYYFTYSYLTENVNYGGKTYGMLLLMATFTGMEMYYFTQQ